MKSHSVLSALKNITNITNSLSYNHTDASKKQPNSQNHQTEFSRLPLSPKKSQTAQISNIVKEIDDNGMSSTNGHAKEDQSNRNGTNQTSNESEKYQTEERDNKTVQTQHNLNVVGKKIDKNLNLFTNNFNNNKEANHTQAVVLIQNSNNQRKIEVTDCGLTKGIMTNDTRSSLTQEIRNRNDIGHNCKKYAESLSEGIEIILRNDGIRTPLCGEGAEMKIFEKI